MRSTETTTEGESERRIRAASMPFVLTMGSLFLFFFLGMLIIFPIGLAPILHNALGWIGYFGFITIFAYALFIFIRAAIERRRWREEAQGLSYADACTAARRARPTVITYTIVASIQIAIFLLCILFLDSRLSYSVLFVPSGIILLPWTHYLFWFVKARRLKPSEPAAEGETV